MDVLVILSDALSGHENGRSNGGGEAFPFISVHIKTALVSRTTKMQNPKKKCRSLNSSRVLLFTS